MATISVCVRMRPYLQHEKGERDERQRIVQQEESQNIKYIPSKEEFS